MIPRIKKAVLQNPIVLAAPLETDLEHRPVTINLISPEGFSLHGIQKFALAALLIPTVLMMAISLFAAEWTTFVICSFMLALVGVIMWVIRLRARMLWRVTWHWEFVEVTDGRYGPAVKWREPLSDFKDLVRDYGLLGRSGKYGSSPRVYGILLAHEDPLKSVLLHASYEEIGPEVLSYYQDQLGLPQLE